MPIWGVDSVESADRLRSWERGSRRERLFEFVTRKLGEPPYFWGRYLRRSGTSMLTEDECRFIHSQRNPENRPIRILPIYNHWLALHPRRGPSDLRRIESRSSGAELYAHGQRDCASALETARRLIPQGDRSGVRIYYDLEGWSFPPQWLRGWWDTMRTSEFVGIGGLYGRGVERERGTSRSLRIRDVDPVVASRPLPYVPGAPPRYTRSGWSANVAEAMDQQFESMVLNPLATRGMAPTIPRVCVWSNTPRTNCRGGPRIEQNFRGLGPAEAHVLVWQYQFACFEAPREDGGADGEGPLRAAAFDMDLATETGYGDMW